MGASVGKAFERDLTVSILSQSERAYLSQHAAPSRPSYSVTQNQLCCVRIAELLLIVAYFRSHGYYQRYQRASRTSKLSLDLVFLCFDFYQTSSPSISCCLYLNNAASKFNRPTNRKHSTFELIDFMQLDKSNESHPVKQTVQLPLNLTALRADSTAMCYVSDIGNISKEIQIQSPCIIRCGRKHSYTKNSTAPSLLLNRPSLGAYQQGHRSQVAADNDHCSAIVFNNSSGDMLHGVEMKLPSFAHSVCDDMIYCPKRGIVAYQSYHIGGCNKLYLLNKQQSEWQPLSRISWKRLSPGMLCDLPDMDRLFVSTKSGESVVVDFDDPMNWQRTANTMLFQHTNNDDSQCMAYNSGSNTLYRAINGTQYFQYSLHKNQWTYNKNMELNLNQLTRGSNVCWNIGASKPRIANQTLFVKQECPKVVHTVFSVSNATKSAGTDDVEGEGCSYSVCKQHKVYTAFFDERDHAQRWRVASASSYKQSAIRTLFS